MLPADFMLAVKNPIEKQFENRYVSVRIKGTNDRKLTWPVHATPDRHIWIKFSLFFSLSVVFWSHA